ncbi:MAG: CvpA family protein [Candidatus Aureabacteria bacterium]|nr:CvpA family protein [Candidatus Auribacterota bacterium]
MNLDLVLLIFFLFCFSIGIVRGFLYQCASLAALIIGLAGAWCFCSILSIVGPDIFIPGSALTTIIATVVFALFYIFCMRFGKRLIRVRALAFSKGFGDRLAGGLFSLLKGALVIFLALCILASVEEEWVREHPRAAMLWSQSLIVELARSHNILGPLPPVRRLRGFLVAARDVNARIPLHGQPEYTRVVSNPRYRELREDLPFALAVKKRDWAAIVMDRRFQDLAADESFWHDFAAVRWEKALEKPALNVEHPKIVAVPSPTVVASPTPPVEIQPAISTVILKRGTALKGKIVSEDAGTVVMDVFLNGGVIRMNLLREEVERIETPGVNPPPTPEPSPAVLGQNGIHRSGEGGVTFPAVTDPA